MARHDENGDDSRSPGPTAAATFARGLLLVFSVPAFVLFATALGFGALARDGGFTPGHAAFLALTVFALPNQVILVDQLSRNETLLAAGLAVTLAAVRLMPMTATLIPLVQGSRKRPWLMLVVAHFTAITTWIEANRRLPALAPDLRLPYQLGVGVSIGATMLGGALAGFALAGNVPPVVSAALLFLTPLYFVLSLMATSRARMDLAALVLGGALSPLLYRLMPGFDLLATGVLGGTLAFLWGRRR